MALTPDRKEKLEQELTRRRLDDIVLQANVHMQEKHKYDQFYRYLQDQRHEIEDGRKEDKIKADVAMNNALVDQDERLALAMNKMKNNEMADARMRQILRETSPELKELEAKLKAAYIQKEQVFQMKEKEAERIMDRERDKAIQLHLNNARITEDENIRLLKEKSIQDKFKYKLELQDQIIFQEQTQRAQYEEFLQEKKFIDDLVERIAEEDQREEYIKHCRMLQTKQDMQAFQAAQQIWKDKQRIKLEKEDKKIKEFVKEKAEIQRKMQKDNAESEAAKARILEKMSQEIYQQKRKEDERRDIIFELNEAEAKEALERKEREKRVAEARKRVEILASLKNQMEERQEQIKKEAASDAAYKEELIAKIANDNRLELLSNEKRRLKMMQIRKDVEQMIVANRQKKAEEMQEKIKLQELEKQEIAKRQQVIEEERLKLLQTHTKNLVGYLPPGVLKEEDLQYLDEDVVRMLKRSSQ